MMLPSAGRDEHRTIVEEDPAPTPGTDPSPQRQRGQVRWTAYRGPGRTNSLWIRVGIKLCSEIDEELPVRRNVALVGVNPSPKPLPCLKAIPPRIPSCHAPPRRWSAPEDHTHAGPPRQQNKHPAAIAKERRQILDVRLHCSPLSRRSTLFQKFTRAFRSGISLCHASSA